MTIFLKLVSYSPRTLANTDDKRHMSVQKLLVEMRWTKELGGSEKKSIYLFKTVIMCQKSRYFPF